MSPNIYMNPDPGQYKRRRNKPSDGIRRVVEETSKRLVKKGWRFVRKSSEAQITVGHACSLDTPDVAHCHGLHPTADHTVAHPPWVWETNRKVLSAILAARYVSVPSPWVADIFARDLGFRPIILPHGIDLRDWPKLDPDVQRRGVLWNKNRARGVCDPKPMEILAQKNTAQHFTSTFGRQTKNLEVTGLVSHKVMKDMLYRSSIYFAPTRETFGIGVLEALAAGCPVICWNWGHTPHLIRDEVDGRVVNPNDHDATSEALAYCLDNWKRLSANARERAETFTWDSVIDTYDMVYKAALEKPTSPSVTIVIPCYNYESFVGEAIASVKNQKGREGRATGNWECIVVDDGSTDDSLPAIQSAVGNDDRFRIFTQPNSGVAAARNRGAVEARGEFLVFLDADDRLRPRFLDLLVPAIRSNPLLGIVYGKLGILHPDGHVSPGTWPGVYRFERQLARHNQVPATNVIRKRAFMRTGGFRQRLAPAEDAELWTRLGLLGWGGQMAAEEITYDYRIHSASATSDIRVRRKDEPDWRGWLSGSNGGPPPAASIAKPAKISHPVRNYDVPDVTIIVPVGDGHEALVQDAIDSVAAQTYPNWELLVVDDTTDGKLPNYGIIPYHQAHPYVGWLRCGDHNVSTARNIGASAAKSKYLCFLDADDILLKNFLRETLPVINEEGPSMVYTDWVELPKGVNHRAEEFTISRLKGQALFAVTFLHTKEAWVEVEGFDSSLIGWEDWDYQIALALRGHCGVHVPISLIGYRYDTGQRREQSLSHKDELLKRIHAKWKDIEPMPCRGCGSRRRRVMPPRGTRDSREVAMARTAAGARALRSVSQRTRSPAPGLIEVEYVGNAQGARIYRCPSGVRYRFGAGRHAKKLVRSEDAEHLKQFNDFVVIPPIDPRQVKRPVPPPQVQAVPIASPRQLQSQSQPAPQPTPTVMPEAVMQAVIAGSDQPSAEEIWPMEEARMTEEDYEARTRRLQRESALKDGLGILEEARGISYAIVGQLENRGWTLETLSHAKVKDITPIDGIGPKKAEILIGKAIELMETANV